MNKNHPDTAVSSASWVFDLQVLEVVAFVAGVLMVFLH
jgi:hypothetical protein